MDDFTQRLVERTRARQEMMQQKMQQHSGTAQRKRRPLLSQNSEENLAIKMSSGTEELKNNDNLESPNKRTRTDCEDSENILQQRSSSDSDVIQSRTSKSRQSGHHVNQRMQKLLNQRKIWEAEEQGHDISYDDENLPSPVIHHPPPPESQKTQSLEHQGRKKRLAALAARVRGWEDDISHHDPPKSPEKSPVRWKPPTGRVQQVNAVPVEKVQPQKASAPVDTTARVVRQTSGDLDIESLAKFAVVGKAAERRSPAKSQQNKSVISISGNAKTVLQTNKQSLIVNSAHASGQQTTHGSKTLQQRMLDLQSNGITEADISAMNTSSANLIMERARAEREKELEELRNRKVHGMKIHGLAQNKCDEEIKPASPTVEKASAENLDDVDDNDDIMGVCENDKEQIKDMDSTEQCDDQTELKQNGSYLEDDNNDSRGQCDEEVYTSACEKLVMEDDDQDEEEDEDGQELSYSDSLLDEDEDSTVNEKDASADEKKVVSPSLPIACCSSSEYKVLADIEEKLANVSGELKTISEEKTEKEDACQMIDDLFQGVLSDEEKMILTPPPRTHSPITIPNLTRQKSKLEIRSELTVRKQTCNEAEDTHALTQQSKFQRTCLSKSNSTESIVSFCQEKDFPVYTISSYRTEKRRQSIGRVDKRVVRNEAANAKAAMIKKQAPDKRPVNEIISDMMAQVSAQQRVIQQASAALNCCYDAHHGKGTITEVEAEKLLLITSERRLALLAEIQQLKQKRTSGRDESNFKPCSGVLVVGGLRLPLRTEYIFSIANKRDAGELRNHYYFVLVRNGHQMFATQLASTLGDLSGDSLVFKDDFTIGNLSSDFKIVLEVYSLNHRTRADGIPVQDKAKGKLSGILHKRRSGDMKRLLSEAVEKTRNKVKKAATSSKNTQKQQTDSKNSFDTDKSLTPKKLRTSKRTSHMPSMMSPGGPNAIRISNFSLIGSTTITLGAITGRKFALQKVPFLSPISGQILCKFSSNFESSISQRGFLTMFDDVGGLGAWHRRWCALRQGKLYSWTYPDDEQYKKPLMSLALRECISRDITTVERILCARPNTFELRTMRPRRQGDRQNLISEDTGSVITTKHWLSADTKEERIAWIESLNQALVDVRAWDMDALKPFK
uniref:anillin-like isoform X2 n=1 Tax=Styela clava TaxID=7725 RepID=UPI00193A272A|nr:anillin-like isoform X2 [Styela clava]